MACALPSRPSLDWLRKNARQRLRELRVNQPGIKLAAVQLALARDYGFSSWRSLKAHVEQLQRGAASEQFSCSFCGKSQHEVRGLIEGGCSNRATSACVFICNECVALSAQIIADTVGNAKPMMSSHTGANGISRQD
jgi:hypothetical protein